MPDLGRAARRGSLRLPLRGQLRLVPAQAPRSRLGPLGRDRPESSTTPSTRSPARLRGSRAIRPSRATTAATTATRAGSRRAAPSSSADSKACATARLTSRPDRGDARGRRSVRVLGDRSDRRVHRRARPRGRRAGRAREPSVTDCRRHAHRPSRRRDHDHPLGERLPAGLLLDRARGQPTSSAGPLQERGVSEHPGLYFVGGTGSTSGSRRSSAASARTPSTSSHTSSRARRREVGPASGRFSPASTARTSFALLAVLELHARRHGQTPRDPRVETSQTARMADVERDRRPHCAVAEPRSARDDLQKRHPRREPSSSHSAGPVDVVAIRCRLVFRRAAGGLGSRRHREHAGPRRPPVSEVGSRRGEPPSCLPARRGVRRGACAPAVGAASLVDVGEQRACGPTNSSARRQHPPRIASSSVPPRASP